MSQHAEETAIYTDGSRASKRAACSFYVPSTGHHQHYRLSDRTTIYAAELAAIEATSPPPPIAFLTIFLGAAQPLEQRRSSSRPSQLHKLLGLCDRLQRRCEQPKTVVWVPSHLGIHGNELADELAKKALSRDAVDIHISPEYDDARSSIRENVIYEWQA